MKKFQTKTMSRTDVLAALNQIIVFHRDRLDCTPVQAHPYSKEMHELCLNVAVNSQAILRGELVEAAPEEPEYRLPYKD